MKQPAEGNLNGSDTGEQFQRNRQVSAGCFLKLAAIKQKLADGIYDSDSIIDATADRVAAALKAEQSKQQT